MDQDLKTRLVHSIFLFKRLLGCGFMMDAAENKSVINMTELFFMSEIAANSSDSINNICLSDVRGYLSISKAAVSHMLSSLEKKGFIIREIDKNNRRNLIVTLTPEGRKVLKSKYDEFIGRLDVIVNYLGKEDVINMITIINRISEVVYKQNNEGEI